METTDDELDTLIEKANQQEASDPMKVLDDIDAEPEGDDNPLADMIDEPEGEEDLLAALDDEPDEPEEDDDEEDDRPSSAPAPIEDGATELGRLINTHMDEHGDVPSFIDGTLADIPNRQVAQVRDAIYDATGDSRIKDYQPVIQAVGQMQQPLDEEGISTMDAIVEGVKMQTNKAIRALNDASGAEFEEMDVIKSAQDSELAEWVGSYGMLVGAGTAVAFAPGWIAAGAASLGIAAAHSWISTYGDDDDMNKYDSVVADLMDSWEGLFPDASPNDMSRAETAARIFVAEMVDLAALGTLGKTFKVGWKGLRKAMKGGGGKVIKEVPSAMDALADAGKRSQMPPKTDFDPADVASMTADDLTRARHATDAALDDIIGKVDSVDRNTRVLEILSHRRSLLNNVHAIKGIRTWQAALDDELKRIAAGINTNKFTREASTYEDYRKAAARALDRFIKGEGDSINELTKYKGYLYHKMVGAQSRSAAGMTSEELAGKVAQKGLAETFLQGTEEYGTEVIAAVNAQRQIFNKIVVESMKQNADPKLIKAMNDAYYMTIKNAEQTASAAGGTLKRWDEFGHKMKAVQKLDEKILNHLKNHAESVGDAKIEFGKKARNLLVKRDKLLQALDNPEVGLMKASSSLMIRAYVDNLLGKGALLTAMTSSLLSGVYEGYAYAVRHGRILSLPNMIRRSMVNTARKVKQRYGTSAGWKEFMQEWTGVKRVTSERFHTKRLRASGPISKGLNMLAGGNIQAMRESDYMYSAMLEPLAEQVALRRLILSDMRAGKTLAEISAELKRAIRHDRGHLGFTMRYNEEVKYTIDYMLLRADVRYNKSILNNIGVAIHNAAHSMKMQEGPVASLLGNTLGVFSRTFANALSQVSYNTALGFVGDPRSHVSRRWLGTATAVMGYLAMDTDDPEALIDIVDVPSGSQKGARRYGMQSGVRVGDRVVPWYMLGMFGEMTRGLLVFKDISDLWLTDDYPMHDSQRKAIESFGAFMKYVSDDSWLSMGLGKFIIAGYFGGESFFRQFLEYSKNLVPGRGLANRAMTMSQGATPASDNFIIQDFLDAVDEATPNSVRRDMFGIPWTAGEARDGTRENVDFYKRLIWAFNPLHRGGTPKANKLRDWVVGAGGFDYGKVHAGDKWLDNQVFIKAMGAAQTNLRAVSRDTYLANGVPTGLSPDGYNSKLGIVGMDWEFTNKLLEGYIQYYQMKADGSTTNDLRRIHQLEVYQSYLHPDKLRKLVGEYYPDYNAETKMVDVLSHLAFAEPSSFGAPMRNYYRAMHRMYYNNVRGWADRDPSALVLTEEEMESLADRSARLLMMNRIYKQMGGLAKRVMSLSPEIDEKNQRLYDTTGEP